MGSEDQNSTHQAYVESPPHTPEILEKIPVFVYVCVMCWVSAELLRGPLLAGVKGGCERPEMDARN